MPATPERQFSTIRIGAAPTYPPDFLPLLQLLLATLADIDYEHESDVEIVRNSAADEWLKQATIRKLHDRHQKRRAPYVRRLESLQRQIWAMAA